jgi:hypothetical protein
MSERKNDVPKLLSKINNKAADNKTGNDTIPITAVTKKPKLLMAFLSLTFLLF